MHRQSLLHLLPCTEVCAHEHLPKFAVVWYREVEQFVNDDIIPELGVHTEKFIVEAKRARCGA